MREKNYYINILCSVKVKTKKKFKKTQNLREKNVRKREKSIFSFSAAK